MFTRRFKKLLLVLALCITTAVSVPVVHKSLPIVRDRECYRAFFPAESFRARLKQPPAAWMVEQITQDLSLFQDKKITLERLEKTYQHLHERAGYSLGNFRYRILDNKLYKFIPDGESFSDTDNPTEKALKTLLLHAQIPDCDFILCSMDGVPEPYMPDDYYFVKNPEAQAPILVQAKCNLETTKHLVLIPDQLTLSEHWFFPAQEIVKANEEILWKDKKSVAIWRGGLSDTGEPTDGRFVPMYEKTPRYRLCKISQERPELVDAGFTGLDSQEMERVARKIGVWKNSLSKKQHLEAKYLPVLDGHMCSYPGFHWRLLSNSACFKQESNQVQWFYAAVRPYVHYVPVKNDMSDLVAQIAWAQEHDGEVQAMVQNARSFASENLMLEHAYYYYWLVLNQYAQCQNIDFSKLPSDSRWKCIQYRKRLGLEKSFKRLFTKSPAVKNSINRPAWNVNG